MKLRLTILIYCCICSIGHAMAQFPVNEQGFGADGYAVDEYGNPIDPHQHDNKIWGRDTTDTEERNIPIGSFAWKIDERFGNITPAEIDTLPDSRSDRTIQLSWQFRFTAFVAPIHGPETTQQLYLCRSI